MVGALVVARGAESAIMTNTRFVGVPFDTARLAIRKRNA